jgi:hypothetical protein
MRYLKIENHLNARSDLSLPIASYSEIDVGNWEVRRVDVFVDGSSGYAAQDVQAGSKGLCELPLPPLDEMPDAPNAPYLTTEITVEEFELVWTRAVQFQRQFNRVSNND